MCKKELDQWLTRRGGDPRRTAPAAVRDPSRREEGVVVAAASRSAQISAVSEVSNTKCRPRCGEEACQNEKGGIS
jgi:hypothetical protein